MRTATKSVLQLSHQFHEAPATQDPHNTLFELRLKVNKTVNLTIEYLNAKNTYLQTVWNVICPIPSQTEFFGRFWLFFNISLISVDKKMAELRG